MYTLMKFSEYVKSWGCKTFKDRQYSKQPDKTEMYKKVEHHSVRSARQHVWQE